MAARTYLSWYSSRALAEQAARTARSTVPGARTMVVDGDGGDGVVGAAFEGAAARSAALGALIAVVVVATTTAALVLTQVVDPGVSLALGGATTVTAAPFVGGLVGLLLGIHRWTGPPLELLAEPPAVGERFMLLVRTTEPERLATAIGPPATVAHPIATPEPVVAPEPA